MTNNPGVDSGVPHSKTLIISSSTVHISIHSEHLGPRNCAQTYNKSWKRHHYHLMTENSFRNESVTYSWVRIYGQLDAHSFIWESFLCCSQRHSVEYPFTPRIARECHTTSIGLAGQICGSARRANYYKHPHHDRNKPSQHRTILNLPSHLSHILPSSPSYPSFAVTFT